MMNVINMTHCDTRTTHMALITALVPSAITTKAKTRKPVAEEPDHRAMVGRGDAEVLAPVMRVCVPVASPSARNKLPSPQFTAHWRVGRTS